MTWHGDKFQLFSESLKIDLWKFIHSTECAPRRGLCQALWIVSYVRQDPLPSYRLIQKISKPMGHTLFFGSTGPRDGEYKSDSYNRRGS